MKKAIVLVTVITALIFTSCSKKTPEPETGNSTSSPTSFNRSFKYSETIRVYDVTKKFFVDVIISANNKGLFELNKESTKNMEMLLNYTEPIISLSQAELQTAAINNEVIERPNPKEVLNSEDNVVIGFGAIEKGNAVSFTLKHKKQIFSEKSNTIFYNYGTVTYNMGNVCLYYRVTNYGAPVATDDYYFASNKWNWVAYKLILNSNYWDFSGIGCANRLCILNAGSNFVYVDITIY